MPNAEGILTTRHIIKNKFSNCVIEKKMGQNQTITCHKLDHDHGQVPH